MWRPLARVRWELPRSEGREHSAERVVDVDGGAAAQEREHAQTRRRMRVVLVVVGRA